MAVYRRPTLISPVKTKIAHYYIFCTEKYSMSTSVILIVSVILIGHLGSHLTNSNSLLLWLVLLCNELVEFFGMRLFRLSYVLFCHDIPVPP